MNHFGIAFGVITAIAIGGAFVMDKHVSHMTVAQPTQSAAVKPNTVADTSTSSTDTTTADAGSASPAPLAPAPQPEVATLEKASPAKKVAENTEPAPSHRTSKSTRSVVASNNKRSSVRESTPTPSVPAMITPPAEPMSTPPTDTAPMQPLTPPASDTSAPATPSTASTPPATPSSDSSSATTQSSTPPQDRQ